MHMSGYFLLPSDDMDGYRTDGQKWELLPWEDTM